MPFFEKNITPKLDENCLNYRSRTTLHFDIGLGSHIFEKKFHDSKIEIFGPSLSPTGIKGVTDQMSPWKAPNDPKTLLMGILHDYKSCWPPMGPFRYPQGAQKGPFGPKQTLELLSVPEEADLVPTFANWSDRCKWRHLVAKFATNSRSFTEINFKLF